MLPEGGATKKIRRSESLDQPGGETAGRCQKNSKHKNFPVEVFIEQLQPSNINYQLWPSLKYLSPPFRP